MICKGLRVRSGLCLSVLVRPKRSGSGQKVVNCFEDQARPLIS